MTQVAISKQGWIEKKGQGIMAGYKKRWLVLYSDKTLKYYEDKSCETLKGTINLSEATKIQNSKEHSNKKWAFGWQVKTPNRDYFISSQSDNDRTEWIENIQQCLHQPNNNNDSKDDDNESETTTSETANMCNDITLETTNNENDNVTTINGLNAALEKQADTIMRVRQEYNELELKYRKLEMQHAQICDERDQLLEDIKVCQNDNKIYKNVINELKNMVTEKNEENIQRSQRMKSVFDLNSSVQRWKTKYFNQNQKIRQLRHDKSHIETEKQRSAEVVQELKDELKHAKSKIKLYKRKQTAELADSSTGSLQMKYEHSDTFESTDSDEKENDKVFNYAKMDDELCKLLQHDLENYMIDQKKNEKRQWKRQHKKCTGAAVDNCIQTNMLKELKLFMDNKAQIKRDWNSLKKNCFQGLFEKYEERLEDKYDNNDEIDSEKLAYNILFDVVSECYMILKMEFDKFRNGEYDNPNVLHVVWMNVRCFYELMKLPMDNKLQKKLYKRVENIYGYIDGKINVVFRNVKKKYVSDISDVDKEELELFMVECCELIWSVLYYGYSVYPLSCLWDENKMKYDDKIHGREGGYDGHVVEYCVFPAIMKDNVYETKIWVICNDNE